MLSIPNVTLSILFRIFHSDFIVRNMKLNYILNKYFKSSFQVSYALGGS